MTDRTRHFQDVSRLSQAASRANDTAKEVIYTMTDTARSNELSPVVLMESGGPALTAPAHAERLARKLEDDFVLIDEAATLRALAAKLAEAEAALAGYREMKELRGVLSSSRDCIKAASSQLTKKHAKALEGKIWGWWYLDQIDTALAAIAKAQGGPNVIPLQMEAAEAERDALDANWETALRSAEAWKARAEAAEDERDVVRAENALLREAVIEAMDMDCAAAAWTILRDALVSLDKGEE